MSAATWLQAAGTSMFSSRNTTEPSGLRISLVVVRNSILAVALRPLRASEDRAPRPVGGGGAGEVRLMGLLPFARLVGARRRVGPIVQPAVPAGRDGRGLDRTVVDDPPTLAVALAVVAVAGLVLADKLALAPGPQPGAQSHAVPPREELDKKSLHGPARRSIKRTSAAATSRSVSGGCVPPRSPAALSEHRR
jgi:hypothetical protein